MNKFFAELVAGLIPRKTTRNRYRGLLRFGIANARRLRQEISSTPVAIDSYCAVCAIAKDEGRYFAEWIEWHRSIGVDKFYIYDNGSSDGTRDILQPYVTAGIVEYIAFPGYRMQLAAYDDCLRRHRYDTQWIAFIDLDEFLVPVRGQSLKEFLQPLERFAAVEVNWLIYGSNGHLTDSPEPVMSRFTAHACGDHPLNRFVKSIVQPTHIYNMVGCHQACTIDRPAADSHGNTITRHFKSRPPQHDIIKINHYAVRSYEEFRHKQARGRASGRHRTVPDDYFRAYDLNDLNDD